MAHMQVAAVDITWVVHNYYTIRPPTIVKKIILKNKDKIRNVEKINLSLDIKA